jgi:cobyrinic acid a,c-diamide synthase
VTPGLVIAGVASSVGKTSVTVGLLHALRRHGLVVQPFKVGPDFIDPEFHRLASGRASYNLDGWMCGTDALSETYARACRGADLAIVEGMMGCFDGVDAGSGTGSTSDVAKRLGLPVVLVVDAAAQARSAAAVLLGFESFDPDLEFRGVILNRVGGARHADGVFAAVAARCRAAPLGAIPWVPSLAIPERHLGLVTAVEGALPPEHLARLADVVERAVDLDRLVAVARGSARAAAASSPSPAAASRATIGVASDAAFQFYYEENLERLREAGARLVAWSPLADAEPPEVDGLYLGGGYPELHAACLAANVPLKKAIQRFAGRGRPIYAECGGLMFLAESLEDTAGASHAMVGLLPARVRMRPGRVALGYAEVRTACATPIGVTGTVGRGHEFHASALDEVPRSVPRAYRLVGPSGEERAEGYLVGRTLMSYVHLHFGSNPGLARAFVDECTRR